MILVFKELITYSSGFSVPPRFLSDFRSSLSKAFDITNLAMPVVRNKKENTCFEKYVFAPV